ncbi:glycosyltransferase family 20-domain-containing protein [Pisolithus marmoratus]|nr:glycosyltransferase family 20-domain-containing protein [Pisolithus marmoratus]
MLRPANLVWVNDYHLMLLPALLRSHPKTASAPIGFFLHVAFPSSEIFQCLSGVLGADLVGFQTANYARHFRQTVSRIFAYGSLPKGIQVGGPVAPVSTGGEAEKECSESAEGRKGKEKGRFVDVGVFPMGIDVNSLREKKRQPEVQYWVQLLRQRYAGMKLTVGRDKLDEIQGVRHKLDAFEHFLKANPEFQDKVVLIQVALQATESNELAGGVSDVVARINAAFSTLTYQSVVFLHVQESRREEQGVDSERAKVNYQALTMADEEAAPLWQDLHNHVVTQTAQAFTTSFLTRCLRAHNEHASLSTDPSFVPSLDLPRLIPKYRHSTSRLIFVDLEGCLWVRDMSKSTMMEMCKSGKGPMVELPEATIRVLESMADDPKNEIWVLSGLPVKGALERLAERVPKVGIVAENGCFVKTGEISNKSSGQSNGAKWINMVPNLDFAWKGPCSSVEERATSVVWRFWTGPPDSTAAIDDDATTTTSDLCPPVNTATSPSSDSHYSDRSWACRQATEAQNHIFDSLGERYGLRIIPSQNSFLVLPNNISRSTAWSSTTVGSGTGRTSGATGGRVSSAGESTLVLGIGGEEQLLRRLNELDDAETVSTSRRGGLMRSGSLILGRYQFFFCLTLVAKTGISMLYFMNGTSTFARFYTCDSIIIIGWFCRLVVLSEKLSGEEVKVTDEQRVGREGRFILIVPLNAAGSTQHRPLEPPWIPGQKMWLLDVRAVRDREKDVQEVDAEIKVLKEPDDEGTSYAILSHRWGTEVDYGEMTGLAAMEARKRNVIKRRDGSQKIIRCCEQAEKDGYSWLWIDTCCIDKRSSAELSEAINSMYQWYRNAQRCYVYLGDVDESTFPKEQDFSKFDRSNGWPEWFSRGWTLQELIAPKEVEFFNKNWVSIGTKQQLTSTLEDITRIPSYVLRSGRVAGGIPVSLRSCLGPPIGRRREWKIEHIRCWACSA